jgi:hypothetical protein
MSRPNEIVYDRVFTQDGESRVEKCRLPLLSREFAPPAPAFDVSDALQAESCRVFRLPPGWRGDWHPTPIRQWLFILSGLASIEVSDGGVIGASAGSIVLLEDTDGMGHRTSVSGPDEVVMAAVQAPLR